MFDRRLQIVAALLVLATLSPVSAGGPRRPGSERGGRRRHGSERGGCPPHMPMCKGK